MNLREGERERGRERERGGERERERERGREREGERERRREREGEREEAMVGETLGGSENLLVGQQAVGESAGGRCDVAASN